MYANKYDVYKNNSVNYASKEQLLLMLVEGAVKFSKISRQAIIDKDMIKANENLKKTQEIFLELIVTLDTSKAPWMEQVRALYTFIRKKLVEVNIKKDVKLLDEIIPLIEGINKMWHDAYKNAKGQ